MPNNLSVASVLEKNRLESDVPFLLLLDIEVVDPNTGMITEVLHIVRNQDDVTVNGQLYTAAMFDITFTRESGAQPQVQATINDFTGALQARIEEYNGGIGFNVTMMIVDGSALSSPPELVEYFQVVASTAAEYKVSFTLGAENEVLMTFPRRRQERDFCSWRYKSAECGYGATYMNRWGLNGAITGNLSQNVTGRLTFGSQMILSAFVVFDASDRFQLDLYNATSTVARGGQFDLQQDGTVTFTAIGGASGGVAVAQTEAQFSGIYLPKNSRMYRVWMRVTLPAGESANTFHARLFPANKSGYGSNIGLWIGNPQLEAAAGTAPTVYQGTTTAVGSTNKLTWADDLANAAWTKTQLVDRTSFNGKVVGQNVGVLADCDLTLQGLNGCAAHNNSLRFGAYSGLNSNGYRYG